MVNFYSKLRHIFSGTLWNMYVNEDCIRVRLGYTDWSIVQNRPLQLLVYFAIASFSLRE